MFSTSKIRFQKIVWNIFLPFVLVQSVFNHFTMLIRDRNTVRNNGDCRNTGSSCPETSVDDAASKHRDLEEIDAKALQLEKTVHNLGIKTFKIFYSEHYLRVLERLCVIIYIRLCRFLLYS